MTYEGTTNKVIAEIRAEMARRSVSQTELAPKAGLSVTALRRRLSGEAPLLVDELFAIARALQVTPAALVARAEVDEPPAERNGRGSPTHAPSSHERNGL